MRDNQTSKLGVVCSLIVVFALSAFAVMAANKASRALSCDITITNNSTLEIRHVYLAHPDQSDWSKDQLNASSISPGGSTTLSNISWDQPNIKVIAEDQNGCFFYQTVPSDANSNWTIANSAVPDCGS